MPSFEVREKASLLPFLFECFQDVPKTRVRKWLRLGCVSVNGKASTKHDLVLSRGDRIEVEPGKKTHLPGHALRILHDDASILVVDKPSGLLTIATEKEKTRTAYFELNELLKRRSPEKHERVFIVHRLDRETSGLLVFARSEEAKNKLQKGWENVDKAYYAVVEGSPVKPTDTLRSRLAQNKAMKVYVVEDEDKEGKLAVTRYRVIRTDGDYSLLEVTPETGRKNQIRVQLAAIGHPVAGDEKYGAKSDPAKRLALHACRLSFKHPATGKTLVFTSALPHALSRIVRQASK